MEQAFYNQRGVLLHSLTILPAGQDWEKVKKASNCQMILESVERQFDPGRNGLNVTTS